MDQDELKLILELRTQFVQDLDDDLLNCEDQLMEFEKSQNEESLNECLRILHSSKGTSSYLELPTLSKYLHDLEHMINQTKEAKNIDLCLDYIGKIRNNINLINLQSAEDFPEISKLAG